MKRYPFGLTSVTLAVIEAVMLSSLLVAPEPSKLFAREAFNIELLLNALLTLSFPKEVRFLILLSHPRALSMDPFMDDDLELRSNRLAMLKQIVDLARGVADFSKLEGF